MFRLTLLVLLLAAPALAKADVIHACVAKSNGKLRIVAAAGMCNTRTETPLDWNQSGPGSGPFQFVGFTTATVGPSGPFNAGILDLTRACGAEFPGARVCKTDEIVFATNLPTITNPDDFAWAIPSAIAQNVDVTGSSVTSACVPISVSSNANAQGLVVDGHGRYSNAACSEAHRVACCVPPVP